jgi:hypothetical protein
MFPANPMATRKAAPIGTSSYKAPVGSLANELQLGGFTNYRQVEIVGPFMKGQ